MPQIQIYTRMAIRNWWIIVLATLGAFNIALIASYIATPTYQARTSFIVSPSETMLAEENSDVVRSIEALARPSVVATYAEILNSQRAYLEAAEVVGLTPIQLEEYELKAVELPGASGIELSIEGPDPRVASQLANAAGEWGINYISELYQVFDITLLDGADVPVDPFRPKPLRDAGVAALLGAALGVGLVLFKELIYQDARETILVPSVEQ